MHELDSEVSRSFTFERRDLNPALMGVRDVPDLCRVIYELSDGKVSMKGSELVKLGIISKETVPETDQMWRLFKIKKRNGKDRQICTPSSKRLMAIHQALKPVFKNTRVSDHSYAYVRGRGALNAGWYVAKHKPNFAWRQDISNFFPSFKDKHIERFLVDELRWHPRVADLVAAVSTYCGTLVQGTVLSPDITNMLSAKMHDELGELCKKNGIHYMAYCDDLYFFGTLDKEAEDELWHSMKWEISGIINRYGLRLNYEKTSRRRDNPENGRSGISVLSMEIHNGYMRMGPEIMRLLRAVLLNLVSGKPAYVDDKDATEAVVRGKLSWMCSINKTHFTHFFSKYVRKLTRWYPDGVENIRKCFPKDFRVDNFSPEPVRDKNAGRSVADVAMALLGGSSEV